MIFHGNVESFMASKNNEDMARREEPTKALTPDKLDRSVRPRDQKSSKKPYPLTEEEATPSTPSSEVAKPSTQSPSRVSSVRRKDKKSSKKTASDYNKFVAHARQR